MKIIRNSRYHNSEVKSLRDILAEVNISMPITSDSVKRIHDYTKIQGHGKVRDFIKNSTIFKVALSKYNVLKNRCEPKAIYLMAVQGPYLFNPIQELAGPNDSVHILGIANDLDLSKCYADPEFSFNLDTCINVYKCVPFIYASDSVECIDLCECNINKFNTIPVFDPNSNPNYMKIMNFGVEDSLGIPLNLINTNSTDSKFINYDSRYNGSIVQFRKDALKHRSSLNELITKLGESNIKFISYVVSGSGLMRIQISSKYQPQMNNILDRLSDDSPESWDASFKLNGSNVDLFIKFNLY